MTPTSDRVVDTLARLYQYLDVHSPARCEEQKACLTVAISRLAGSGGSEIARALGARLGWPVYDHELLTRIAEERGLHTKLLERLDERAMSWLEEIVSSFHSNEPTTSERQYIRGLLELLAGLGKTGHCIIVGRAAAQVLPIESTLRVRVVAPRDQRIKTIENRLHLSHDHAAKWVDHTDKERERFIERHFHKDPYDPLGYDLVLNSGRFNVNECVEIIARVAEVAECHMQQKTVKN